MPTLCDLLSKNDLNLLFDVLLQVMEFYCQSCETAMCQDCTGGEHAEHPTVPLKDVVEQHKAALQAQLDAVKKRYCKESFSSLLMYQQSLVNELWASVLK